VLPSFLGNVPLVGLLRGVPPGLAAAAAAACVRGGITAIEVTMDSEDPLRQLAAIQARVPDVMVGVGTVLTLDEAQEAVAAGAAFVVSPHFDEVIVRYCIDEELPVIPGAATPTEILQAWRAGAALVKVFPAGPLGVAYVRAVTDAIKRVALMVTGGITETNLASFFAAGASAATVGSWLFSDEALASAEMALIESNARRLVSALKGSRQALPDPSGVTTS
jgi:2-dehydro-3-deoxyphosphogluconate aldolase/(4S)-4-hydroxy-2-oxoglutarate aldolase